MTDPGHIDAEYCTLTRSQLMIWTGQRLQPDDPLYNMVLAFRIRGAVDVERFKTAFYALIAQCDALRTTFGIVRGVPKQCIHEELPYDLQVHDLSGASDPEHALREWLQRHAVRPFDLEKCLFESALIRLDEDDFVWFFNQHHLVTDAWSIGIIYREMQACYDLAGRGRLDEAGVLPGFRHHVEHEIRQRDARSMQRATDYWQERLRAPLAPSEFFRPTPPDRSGMTVRTSCDVGRERSKALRTLAGTDQYRALTTDLARFQLFASVFLAWLYRVTGNRTLSMGTPNHNRPTARDRQTAGLFIEIYPLRIDVDAGETFASLHQKVARRTMELLMNAPSGASGFEHNRAYDVLLNYITAAFGDFAGLPAQSEWVHAGYGDRNHLVRVQVEDFDIAGEFRVFFDLNADSFQPAERERVGRQFLRLLDAFITNPDVRLAAVDILDEDERARLAEGFRCHEEIAAPAETVLHRFLAQVERTPEAPAVSCGVDTFSYAELARQSAGLAARLVAEGVNRGDRVAVMLPRSTAAVVAFLACMRCGASYVPVDPAYPRERIDGMLEDAGVSVVLVAATAQIFLPERVRCISVDITAEPDAAGAVEAACQIGDSAYIIFTSGSTGRPKGVEVTHEGLANYIAWAERHYLDGEVFDWPLFSSLSFDLTVTSIFVPLVSGGRIVVYPESADRREILIREVVEDNAVDIVKLTPAHLALLQVMDLSQSRIRKLIVGGENLKTDLARSVSRYFGDRVDIYNEYGPTEGTVGCMIHRFNPACDAGATVPIGKAIDNCRVYVCNEEFELQPEGVVGELAIGGAGLARGYVNRPDLTVERFVANPLRPGELMYRTGDLARSNADGTLTCLGRIDDQFKINGIRAEPEEIEAALEAHPQVRESAVRLVERSSANDFDTASYCLRCGLSSLHPDAALDGESICRICRVYEAEADRAKAYFRTREDLQAIARDAREGSSGPPDCMMLLSGGKDSTYALCQLVELGLTPLVFTLDNGFISDGAKSNVRRVVDQLGLELHVARPEAMNAIFVDSLHRFSNVCNGCFKTIYTLSMRVAQERGIRHIFTGLSRGQIFESRVADLFRQRIFDPERIDRTIIDARKAYHRAHDAVTEHLDTSHFEDDAIFETIRFVDYYRYTDVSLDEMLDYLNDKVPWVRPADTGRSTNCLINEAGIYVHKKERGYHNYALPYSWDVRLGHKERDAAREELDDDIDVDNVQKILAEVGYLPRKTGIAGERQGLLAAYYAADEDIPVESLRDTVSLRLPRELVPAHFIRLDRLPLTPNGKLDRGALPDPDFSRPELAYAYAAPESQAEHTLADIWSDVLGIDRVGANDNFFELGGDSIMNIQIVAAAAKAGLRLSPQQVFDYPTVRELVTVLDTAGEVASEQGPVTGIVPLTPAQHRFFKQDPEAQTRYTQQVLIRAAAPLDSLVLEEALRQLVSHHDALRASFRKDASGWQQDFAAPAEPEVIVERVSASKLSADAFDALLEREVRRLQEALDLERGALLRVLVFDRDGGDGPLVLLLAHHLVVDAVSWWVLLEDLELAYRSLRDGNAVRLPAKTTSMRYFAETLGRYTTSATAKNTESLWQHESAAPLPLDLGGENDIASRATLSVALNARDTDKLLTDAVSKWRLQPQDLLVAALLMSVAGWSGQRNLLMDLESHGREAIDAGLDLLRTVGWFTSVYPIGLSLAADEDTAGLLRRVRQQLRSIPHGGVAYGALRYLGECRSGGANASLLFNYLGKWRRDVTPDSLFRFERPVMAELTGTGNRAYIFEINAAIFEGRLRIEWTYSRNLHRRDTVRDLLRNYRDTVSELANYCASTAASDFVPEDFPSADLSQDELDEVIKEFGGG